MPQNQTQADSQGIGYQISIAEPVIWFIGIQELLPYPQREDQPD